jgi:hypothetical protein
MKWEEKILVVSMFESGVNSAEDANAQGVH